MESDFVVMWLWITRLVIQGEPKNVSHLLLYSTVSWSITVFIVVVKNVLFYAIFRFVSDSYQTLVYRRSFVIET